MYTCNKCNKKFKYESKLKEHLNKKNPCNQDKPLFPCNLCKIIFKYKSEFLRHEQTKKHIENYNLTINGDVHIGDNNINNIINLTLNTNSFINTDIEFIQRGLINDIGDCLYVNTMKKRCNEFKKISILFDEVISLLEKLHFTIDRPENHNLKVLLVFPSSINATYEYLILEIDQNTKKISWNAVDYTTFLNIILDHLLTLNNRYKNVNYTEFIYYLKDKLIKDINELNNQEQKNEYKEITIMISNKLSKMYIDFNKKQNKPKRENHFKIQEKINEYKNYRDAECTLDNGYTPEIINSMI